MSGHCEAHRRPPRRRRKSASERSQSPAVEQHDVVDAGAAQLVRRPRRAPRGGAPRSARAARRRDVSTRSCAAGLGVDEPEVADVGQLLLARVADLDRDHVVPAGELEQRAAPVARAAEVGDDDDQRRAGGRARRCAPSASPSEVAPPPSASGVARAARAAARAGRAALARGQDVRLARAERDDAEPVAAPGRDVADRERDALGDVGLAPVGGPEGHRRRGVEHEPRVERALGDVDADVRLARARGDVPVDHGARRRPAGRDAPARARSRARAPRRGSRRRSGPSTRRRDDEVERAQDRVRGVARPGARARRRARRPGRPGSRRLRAARSMCGTGIACEHRVEDRGRA